MHLADLPRRELRDRLRGPGITLPCGPLSARLATTLPELADAIALLYADYPFSESDNGICDFEVRVVPVRGFPSLGAPWARALVDGRSAFGNFRRGQALPMFEWAINWCVFTRPNQYLLLHAAVVERGGRALVLSGRPGAGKSTLTAGLILRGWRLLSDEVTMIPVGGRDALPVPRPVSLKDGAIDLVRALSPAAVLGPAAKGTKKGTVAHLRPPTDSVRRADEPALPAWVVFPKFAAGSASELRPVSRAQALLRAGDEAFNYSMLGSSGFETLANAIDGCTCFNLPFGDLHEALALLDGLTAAPTSARAHEGTRPTAPADSSTLLSDEGVGPRR